MKALDTSSGVWVENSDFSGSSPVEQPHKIDLPPGHANAQAGCFRDHHQFSGEMFYKPFADLVRTILDIKPEVTVLWSQQ